MEGGTRADIAGPEVIPPESRSSAEKSKLITQEPPGDKLSMLWQLLPEADDVKSIKYVD